jgi:serine/threonine protein phosphatase 1
MRLGESRTPDNMRVYAVGDVHGCNALLAEAHAKIAADLAARPVADHRIVHIGDYTDRGPNSAGVVERMVNLTAGDKRIICLMGNHDERLLAFLREPIAVGPTYLSDNMGGSATLMSYGVPVRRFGWLMSDFAGLARRLSERMPPQHRAFLESLRLSARLGDYFFCHAGIRPGIPLDQQDPDDLFWIREEFLLDDSDHGVVVVHGHTPMSAPELRPNRINIDTGAVFGGPLTCLVLEGRDYRFL